MAGRNEDEDTKEQPISGRYPDAAPARPPDPAAGSPSDAAAGSPPDAQPTTHWPAAAADAEAAPVPTAKDAGQWPASSPNQGWSAPTQTSWPAGGGQSESTPSGPPTGWTPPPSQPAWTPPPSAQAGWPPAAQPGWSPPPGQSAWSAPGQPGQPGYPGQYPAQPGAWPGQQAWAPPTGYYQAPYATSALVVIAGVVLLVFGLLMALVGGLGVAISGAIEQVISELGPTPELEGISIRSLRDIFVVVFGIALVLGVLHIVSSIGVFVHKQWARIIGIILAVLGTLLGVLSLAGASSARGTGSGDLAVSIIIVVAYGFTLFALVAGGGHFRRRYPG